jgi:glycosyltransferase involved in cell wall biosynthesis
MDWLANIDAMNFLMEEIWPSLAISIPGISMTVVGRNPPRSMVDAAKDKGIQWEFTGFVDDVRPYVRNASIYVIPLRVGGGTRIKAYEAMAMGCPVVSTSIGVEGLPVEAGRHYRRADTPSEFLSAILGLIREREARETLSTEARRLVEENFSSKAAAKVFENICSRVAENSSPREPLPIG